MAEPTDLTQFKIKQKKEVIKQRDEAFIKRGRWVAARRPWLKEGIEAVMGAYQEVAILNEQFTHLPRYEDKLIVPRIKCITEENKGKARMLLSDDNLLEGPKKIGAGFALLTFGQHLEELELPQELLNPKDVFCELVVRRGKPYDLDTFWRPIVVICLLLDRLRLAGFWIGNGWRITKKGRVTMYLKKRREEVRVEVDFKQLQSIRAHQCSQQGPDPT